MSTRAGGNGGGFERFVLSLALLAPVAIASISIGQFATVGWAGPSLTTRSETAAELVLKRPPASQPQAPPTLAAPTSTPAPTATPVPTATPRPKTYVVKPGDELKHIAAEYHVNIFTLIRANSIPDPDNLRIGQELRIPEE